MKLHRYKIAILLPAMLLFAACEDEGGTINPPAPQFQITVEGRWARVLEGGKQVSLQSNDVWDILVDSNGKLWIGNSNGVARYASINSSRREAAYDQNNGLPNPKVRAMVEYDGRIYFGTWGGGVGVFDMNETDPALAWTTLRESNSNILSDQVSDVEIYSNQLYIATNKGVSIYNTNTSSWQSFTMSNGLAGPRQSGQYKCDGCPVDPLTKTIEIAETTTRGLEKWYGASVEYGYPPNAAGNLGVTVVRTGSVLKYTTFNSDLPEPGVNDIFYDADTDHFWLAMNQTGVARVDVDGSTWDVYTMEDGLPSNVVFSVTKADGRIWVGTQAGLAGLRSDGKWVGYARGGGLPADRVRGVRSDDGQRLWLSFIDGGACRVNPASAQGL